MQNHNDVLLASAGSVWSFAASAGNWVMAYVPGILTIIYVAIKIYYKVKHERQNRHEDED